MDFFTSSHSSIKIAYDIFKAENEKFRVLFLTGRAEYYSKYHHFFQLLNDRGISVFTIDHRGQGASGRMLDDSQKGHVENFNFYVDDADFFLKNHVLKNKLDSVPVFSISHSMGGAVSLLLGGLNPGIFQKMVFCSPMWGINFGKIPDKFIFFLSKMLCAAGFSTSYAPGKGKYNTKTPFDGNQLTHNLELFEKQKTFLLENPGYILGGPTNNWVFESLKAIHKINFSIPQPASPVLLLQAGADSVVNNVKQNFIIKNIPGSHKIVVENGWHELLYEENNLYFHALTHVFQFLNH